MPNRIRELRFLHGKNGKAMSQQAVADAAGTDRQQVHKLETGRTSLTPEWMRKLAKAFGCRPAELLPLEDWPRQPMVPVVGRAHAGEVSWSEKAAPLGYIEVMPPMVKWTGVVVDGHSMMPAYEPGDVVFFDGSEGVHPSDAIGRECVVGLEDGRVFLRRLERGSRDGVYRLVSLSSSAMDDVAVAWAAPIRIVKRSGGDIVLLSGEPLLES